MEMTYFCCYHSYLKKCEKLTDQELGRLFRALLHYSMTDERTELAGRESIAFDFIVEDIDRAKVNYAETCKKNAENGKKGGRPRKQAKSEGFLENRTVFSETQKSQGQRSKVKIEDDSLRSSSDARAREGDDEQDDQREKEILGICEEAIGSIDAAERTMLLAACAGVDMEEIRKAVSIAKGYGARTAKYLAQVIQTQRQKTGRKPKEETGQVSKILRGGLRPAPKIPGSESGKKGENKGSTDV